MKHTISLLLLITLSISLPAQNRIAASDSLISYIGRTYTDKDTVSYDWSGVTAKISFTGTTLTMVCSDTKGDWFNVWVDKEPVAREDSKLFIKAEEGEHNVVIAQKLRKGHHTVTIQKRTEGEQGRISITSFGTDGHFEAAPARKARLIEFIGDSYTCGYGTESSSRDDPFKAETENCNLTYAAIAGRYFDADIYTVCHSGMGIARNYGGSRQPTMVERYTHTFDMYPETQWKPSGQKPDIIVIYLGTNDFSTGSQPTFRKWSECSALLLKAIRGYYGEEVPILCVASNANSYLAEYIRMASMLAEGKNIHWTSIQEDAHNRTSDLGASWHPNYEGQRKVASCMIPYIATLTGWDMPYKVVE